MRQSPGGSLAVHPHVRVLAEGTGISPGDPMGVTSTPWPLYWAESSGPWVGDADNDGQEV